MSEPKLARPPQVTAAGWLVVGGSVAVVLMAFAQVADLRSMETREAVEAFLAEPPADGLGLGVQDALSLLRIGLMVAAASGAATAILGWHVLQRSRGARVALSLLAVPLFISGLVGGGVASAVVVAAIVMLWFQPARDWFDGVTRAPVAPPMAAPDPFRDPVRDPVRDSARDPLLDLPPPTAPPLHPTPYAAGATAADATPADAARPASVTWACSITWLSTLVVLVLMGSALVQLLVTPEVYVDEFHRQNPDLTVTDADLRVAFVVLFSVVVVWAVIAAGLAVLVWRGAARAAVALTVSAVLACLTLFPIVACVATLVLLQRPESRAWLRRSGRPSRAG
jgi:hypothetical protein